MSDPLAEALAALPHGPEFRFVDRLLALDPGRGGVGEYTLRGDEPWLAGHFPGAPLLPGVLLVEAGAQLAGIVAQSAPDQTPGAPLRLTALRRVKFPAPVHPGETVRLEARLTARLGGLVQAEVRARVAAREVLHGEVVLSQTAA
jgi:3-hydroxyacyl-[acyl-carrier-protein] dehydratase